MRENADIIEKLSNHRLPIDESYWAEMEQRLQNSRKKVVPLWMWLAGTGIAASLALLFTTVRFFNTDNEVIGTQITQIEQISTDNNKNEQVVEIQEITQTAQISTNNTLHKSTSLASQEVTKVPEIEKIEDNINTITQTDQPPTSKTNTNQAPNLTTH